MGENSPFDDAAILPPVRALYAQVYEGFDEGNLAPLIEYLRSGFPMFADLREQLALEIENGRLAVAKPTKSGPSFEAQQAAQDRRMQVGAYIVVRVSRLPRGSLKWIIGEAADKFGVSEDSARLAYRSFKTKWADLAERIWIASFWTAALRQLCAETGLSFDDEFARGL